MMIIYGNTATPVKAVVIKVIVCHVAGMFTMKSTNIMPKKKAFMLYFDFF